MVAHLPGGVWDRHRYVDLELGRDLRGEVTRARVDLARDLLQTAGTLP